MEQIITGKEINYLHVCRRKLWLFSHGIRPELQNDAVQLGMQLQEKTFSREEKEIPIGEIGVLDFADFKDGVIHETKRGKTPGAGDEAQVRYYMYFLHHKGLRITGGVIHYPIQRKTLTLKWDSSAEEKAMDDLQECRKVIDGELPLPSRRPICKSCAYEEICFA